MTEALTASMRRSRGERSATQQRNQLRVIAGLPCSKRCPVAGRCQQHNDASPGTASSRRMISAVPHGVDYQKTSFLSSYDCVRRQAPCSFRCSSADCDAHAKTHQLAMTERITSVSRIARLSPQAELQIPSTTTRHGKNLSSTHSNYVAGGITLPPNCACHRTRRSGRAANSLRA
jgi:hypothetical protein